MSNRSARTFPASAECYDRQINWTARLSREIPFLVQVFGPPGQLGLLDAGCGSGRHAAALAERGYRVTAADASTDMVRYARRVAREQCVRVRLVHASFAELPAKAGGPFDGVLCIGNSLPLAGSGPGIRSAVGSFARLLRPGGHLLIQVINFARMLPELRRGGYVRGPHVLRIRGRDYVSVKVFHASGRQATLTGVTLWKEAGVWKQEVFRGRLYPIEAAPLCRWLRAAGFRILKRLGSYAGESYAAARSPDLILVCERTGNRRVSRGS